MTSPLRRKRQTTPLNTKVRSRSKLRRRIAALFAFRRASRLGLLAAVAVSLVASAATAADESSAVDSAWLSGGGRLHWRAPPPPQGSRPSEGHRANGVQTARHGAP